MADDTLRLGAEAQAALVQYCRNLLDEHKKINELHTKFEIIDVAYARYKQLESNGQDGVDVLRDELDQYGLNFDEINIPIVVSHVDSYVGYFADVFLSGYPMFPVVSTPETRPEAEALQSIIDTHAKQGRYARQLSLSFYDDAKYNFSTLELDWCMLDDFNILSAYEQIKSKNSPIAPAAQYYNKLKRWDPYNTIIDTRVLPADIPYCADFHGHIELISAVELKRRLTMMNRTKNAYNEAKAFDSKLNKNGPAAAGAYYRELPQISSILGSRKYRKGGHFDWDAYLTSGRTGNSGRFSNCFEFVTIYARIIPNMMKMSVPSKGTPQVWKLCFVNHEHLVFAERQFNVYDTLPVYIGQPSEDGFGYQTQSVAENSIAFQEGSSKLFSIRLNSARRAVMDRALYDPSILSPSHIDTSFAAPKIPIKDNSLMNGKKITDAYHQIPFDSRGTETVIQDMASLMGLADKLNGVNQPMQGQFQKGNKTRKEWEDTMEGATNRLRLRGLSLEMQQILLIKEQIKFNIYKHNVTGKYQSQSTGNYYDINSEMLQRIKDKIGNFEIADGYNPSAKLASTEVIIQGMQVIMNSPILQQSWGPALPQMFAHMMSLGGVKGLEQYLPQQQTQQAALPTPPGAVNGQPPVI